MKSYRVVLGSRSPRRKELLSQIVTDFDIRVADVDEHCLLTAPAQYVMYTACKKAMALPLSPREVLLTADTTVCLDNQFLGKPHSPAEATAMLRMLNGRVNVVYTGVCLRTSDSLDVFFEASEVRITMSEREIERYVASGNACDKAGAYGIQDDNLRAELLRGSLSNVVGLPIEAVRRHMTALGL